MIFIKEAPLVSKRPYFNFAFRIFSRLAPRRSFSAVPHDSEAVLRGLAPRRSFSGLVTRSPADSAGEVGAFTLIELLVVVALIGVLVTFVAIGFTSIRANSRDAKRISDIKQIQTALELYYTNNSIYPSTLTAGQAFFDLDQNVLMKNVPNSPSKPDGSCLTDTYVYTPVANGGSYTLKYCLGKAVETAGPGNCKAVPGEICTPNVPGWALRTAQGPDSRRSSIISSINNEYFTAGVIYGNYDFNQDGSIQAGTAESAVGFAQDDAFIASYTNTGTHRWSIRLGGINGDYGAYGVASNSNGDVIVVGSIRGSADFDQDGSIETGTVEVSTDTGNNDVFLVVYDNNGQYRWAKRMGTTSNDYGAGVAVDSQGRIVMLGRVTSGPADINGDGVISAGWPETNTYGGDSSTNDMFIAIFDDNGTNLWSQKLGGWLSEIPLNLAIDSSDNFYIAGYVQSSVDFDGDRVGNEVAVTGEPQTGYASNDGFLLSYTMTGTFRWARRFGSTSSDTASGIAIDTDNNVYISGTVIGAADLNGNASNNENTAESSSYGNSDMFVSSFSSAGTHRWSKRFGGVSNDDIRSLIVGNGLLYMTGNTTGPSDLNGDSAIQTSYPETAPATYALKDAIVIALNLSDGSHVWSRRMGGTGDDEGLWLAMDQQQVLLSTGSVRCNVKNDLDGNGSYNDGGAENAPTTCNSQSGFLVKFGTID